MYLTLRWCSGLVLCMMFMVSLSADVFFMPLNAGIVANVASINIMLNWIRYDFRMC